MNETPSRKLLEKQLRRQADEAKRLAEQKGARRRNLLTLAVIVVVIAGAVFLIQNEKAREQVDVGVSLAEAGCGEIERPPDQGRDHIEEGTAHDPYSSDPPTSGPHYGTPADAGFYTDPLTAETVVHNLEHGQIVIWYSPELAESELDQLEGITRDQAIATVTVPGAFQPPTTVVMTAWGALQRCEKVSEAAINAFRAEFQGRGPENVGVPRFEDEEEQ